MDKFDLIHIGHGKCLSTMLQRRWAMSDRYNYFHGLAAGNTLSQAFLSGARDPANHRIDINLNADKPNILSYECFTFFGCAEDIPETARHLTLERQAFIAATLAPLSDRVLLVLRDPKDWIRSCHAQYVKYGGSLPLQAYFETFRKPLLDNLRLDRILEIWRANGFEPIVLPMEDYKADPCGFWALYERLTGLPAPEDRPSSALADNRTEHDRLETRAATNALIEKLIALMERNPLYQSSPEHRKERDSFAVVNSNFKMWTVRRAFEAMSPAEFEEFRSGLNLAPETGFSRLALDAEAQAALAETYLAPLEEFSACRPHLAGYHAGLSA
ncbi:hypothetical protein [Brevirhabdus sp.]|uniref:hypothetical protein n=1 Tax=Brevirhabdus sp. TaxID=2004514 RepID=UPI0040599966